jgi:hypothetical protein
MSKYCCEICVYSTNVRQNYTNHIASKRHNENVRNREKNISNNYICVCKKEFKSFPGFNNHKKICKTIKYNEMKKEKEELEEKMKKEKQDLEEKLERINKTLIQIMKNQVPEKISITNNNVSNDNSHNFNINFFLQEQCKDATDIMVFSKEVANEIQNLIDVRKIPDIGYVESMTLAITNLLKKYDIYKRPIHNIENNDDIHYFIRYKNDWKTEYSDTQTSILDKAIKHIDSSVFEKVSKMPSFTPQMQSTLLTGTSVNRLRLKKKVLDKILKKVIWKLFMV